MSKQTKTAIGFGCGGLAVVLGGLGLIVMATTGRALAPLPDGEALMLTQDEVAGSWSDGEGGTVELAADGTFTATELCGHYVDSAAKKGAAADASPVRTGAGTWSVYTPTRGNGPATRLRVEFAAGATSAQYEARGSLESPVLWAYVGDADDGRLCALRKRS
uniref:Uncharacterized protein n=1 Tax=Streptomyces sp. NBC_00049 TaxID=2903617 RepID=A0AAU2JSK8_9ACTN